MNEKIVETVFPGTIEKIENKLCPICGKKIERFRDQKSIKEYEISGMCQKCQDEIF